MTDLRPGWAVLANDDEDLGVVRAVTQNFVRTSRPGFAADLFIPASAIAIVKAEAIYLNVSKRDAATIGWEDPPRSGDALETIPQTDLHRHI
jgi:hypothetical protein